MWRALVFVFPPQKVQSPSQTRSDTVRIQDYYIIIIHHVTQCAFLFLPDSKWSPCVNGTLLDSEMGIND